MKFLISPSQAITFIFCTFSGKYAIYRGEICHPILTHSLHAVQPDHAWSHTKATTQVTTIDSKAFAIPIVTLAPIYRLENR